MLIKQVHRVGSELQAFAQHRLRLYRNPSFTAEQIIRRHSLPSKHHDAAKKQALEIRACLSQAQEYFDAAKAVSPATRPLQLYYGLMSLALACVLMKGDAKNKLARLREHHNGHGLSLSLNGDVSRNATVGDIASRLRAVPQSNAAGPYGTFEVWRQYVRDFPAPIEVVQRRGQGSTIRLIPELIGADVQPKPIPRSGCSLLRALKVIPSLQRELVHAGLSAGLVRVRVNFEEDETRKGSASLIVQPGDPEAISAFSERLKLDLQAAQSVHVLDVFDSGFGMQLPLLQGRIPGHVSMPQFMFASGEDLLFVADDWDLGEFGACYIGLHIAGNLVRYYPDIWVPHVEHATAFAELIHAMCMGALERLPVLVASELDGCMYF